eukprot:scaffold1960_cov69-Cylindrotheca_fusiformis.AAC.1
MIPTTLLYDNEFLFRHLGRFHSLTIWLAHFEKVVKKQFSCNNSIGKELEQSYPTDDPNYTTIRQRVSFPSSRSIPLFDNLVVVKKQGPTSPVAGGADVTYAEFVQFHVLDATVMAQFNNEKYDMAWDKQNVDGLKAYYAWMKSRPILMAWSPIAPVLTLENWNSCSSRAAAAGGGLSSEDDDEDDDDDHSKCSMSRHGRRQRDISASRKLSCC